MDPLTLALTLGGLCVAIITAAIGVAQYQEARRARLLSERSQPSPLPIPEPIGKANQIVSASTRVRTRQRVTVGCFPYPPLAIWHQGKGGDVDRFDGPWTNVVVGLAQRMNLELDPVVVGAPAFADTSKWEIDVVPGLFKTDRRASTFEFSRPLHRIGLQGVCKSSRRAISKEEMAAGDIKVVVQVGEVGWEYVTRELSNALNRSNVCQVTSIATHEALQMLVAGDYDIAISDEISCLHFLRHFRDQPFRLAFPRPLQIFDACVAVRKGLNWNMAEVDRHIVEIRNTPTFLKAEAQSLRGFEHAVERCGLE